MTAHSNLQLSQLIMTWTHKLHAQVVLINCKIRYDFAYHFSKIVEALSSIGFVTVNSMFANFTACSRNFAKEYTK